MLCSPLFKRWSTTRKRTSFLDMEIRQDGSANPVEGGKQSQTAQRQFLRGLQLRRNTIFG
jgi:hypothetical protein